MIENTPKPRPADPIDLTARGYNEWAAEIERRSNLTVSGPISLFDSPSGGRMIGLLRKRGFFAQLYGTANPYRFAEAGFNEDGTLSPLQGAFTGDATDTGLSAYEVNDVEDLNEKYAWLEPGAAGDFRFQWIGDGPTPPCRTYFEFRGDCVSGCYHIIITDSVGTVVLDRFVYYGLGYAGILLAIFEFLAPGSGTYSVHVVHLAYAGTNPLTPCSPPGGPDGLVDQTFSVDIDCAHPVMHYLDLVPNWYDVGFGVCALGCFDYDPYGNPTTEITWTASGPGTITRGPDGLYCANWTVRIPNPPGFPAEYTITASADGYISNTVTITILDCHSHNAATMFLTKIAFPVDVSGCGWRVGPITGDPSDPDVIAPLEGATVTLSGGLTGSCTTDATGECDITIAAQFNGTPIHVLVTHPRFEDVTATLAGDSAGYACHYDGVMTTPKPGYHCFCCPEPMTDTIHATIGGYAVTLDWTTSGYRGEFTITHPAYVSPWTFVSPTCSAYLIPNTATGGQSVCVSVLFDGTCSGLTLSYWASTFNGDAFDGDYTPTDIPCVPLTSPSHCAPFLKIPYRINEVSPVTSACKPFLATGTVISHILGGDFIVSE